ncbi:MAG: 30S ribosomal protein S9 [Sedimentisphaerales bacterium]|nr:30S ribosomal protein S9 [Sedimentisphaerales bacterium]
MADIEIQNPDVTIEDNTEQVPAPAPSPSKGPKSGFWWGTGRRKSSVARVRIKPGSGKTIVNKKNLDEYFKRDQDRKSVLAPLKAVKCENLFDIFINVKGGGTTGQSGAALLGVARALRNYDISYVPALRDSGHLTRDPRMVERKKPGRAGARKRFQFSKR